MDYGYSSTTKELGQYSTTLINKDVRYDTSAGKHNNECI